LLESCTFEVSVVYYLYYYTWYGCHDTWINGMTADQLGRQGFSHPGGGPEPAFGVCGKVTRGVIRGQISRKHEE
jgi:hypothetical protein